MTKAELEKMGSREFLAAPMAPGTANPKTRTVNVVFFTGVDIARIDWSGARYIRRFDPQGADLSLLNNGAPVLDNHSLWGVSDQKGVVERAWTDGGLYKATLRFSQGPRVAELWQDIQDGIVTKFSMGTEILTEEEKREKEADGSEVLVRVARKWRPFEISVAPVPADFGTTTLAAETADQTRATARQEEHMKTEITTIAPAATEQEIGERNRVIEILKVAKAANVDEEFALQRIKAGSTIEAFRVAALNEAARKSDEFPTRSHHAKVRDLGDGQTVHMAEALAARYLNTKVSPPAERFIGARLADLAAECLRAGGHRVHSFNPARNIEQAMHTTGDFPLLLQGTGERLLLAGYNAAIPAIKRVCRQSTVADFRTKYQLRLGEAPKLLRVPEGADIGTGSRAESRESYRAYTYARIFIISREGLVNDDLSAFADFAQAWGQSAASLEGQLLVDLLTSNGGVGPKMGDGVDLFDAAHFNLEGGGAAITPTSLGVGRLSLRMSKGLDAETLLETAARYLVVPAAKETIAETCLAALYPAVYSNVNPFAGKLELVVEPRLDAKSATGWYLFGDPANAPVLEFSYLADSPGPQVAVRPGWEVLGAEFRCVLDIGVGAVGFRGVYKNPGA